MSIPRILPVMMLVLGVQASPSFCQIENVIGLTPAAEWGSCLYAEFGSINTANLILFDPVNHDFGEGEVRDVALVSGFEIRMRADGAAAIAALRPSIPGSVITRDGTYGVRYAEALEVADGQFTILAEIDIYVGEPAVAAHESSAGRKRSPMPCDQATGFVYLLPPVPSSIPGSLVYFDAEDDLGPAVAASAWAPWPGEPDLRIQVVTVGADGGSWGSIKAVYR